MRFRAEKRSDPLGPRFPQEYFATILRNIKEEIITLGC
jgi:hypothetical protein